VAEDAKSTRLPSRNGGKDAKKETSYG